MEKNTNEFKEEFRKSLPIYQHRDQILKSIQDNLFCIITGDTGSGKTTQIPQYIMESLTKQNLSENPDLVKGDNRPRIVITQPRRVATIQMAKRVSYEKNYKLGEEIGYSIRFEDCSCDKTLIKYVTDGILVRECLANSSLPGYNVIILDEAHERSLYTDILFALCKKAVLSRENRDLRLIITSATLDTKQFSSYFNDCPVYSIQGRCYPVDIRYITSRMEKRVENCVKIAIRIHLHEGPGHILAFLTGFEECEQACKICYSKLEELAKIKNKNVPPMLIMPLYGAQNTDEQSQVFEKAPENCRKLIFSTNIAETSLTVDGIGFVIDCGYVKQKIFNPRTSMDSLMIVPISKVQAIQRAGRAGRTGPGKCIRLYSEQFFDSQMSKVTIPEILRVNLASTILTLKSMGIDNVIEFEFMEKPEKEALMQALKQLYFLQAIDINGKITTLGYEMAKFPLDCCYSRTLIASHYLGIEDDINTLVSLISCESVWFNVNKYDEERRANFDEKRLEFIDKFSDHMTFLNIFNEWKFNNFSEDWCKANFLHYRALKQSKNIKEQLRDYLNKVNYKECEKYFNLKNFEYFIKDIEISNQNDYFKINTLMRIALCQGFYMNAAKKANGNEDSYIRICDGTSVTIDSFSAIALKGIKPDFLIYTELGGSNTKAVMKQVSIIDLKWISDLVSFLKNVDVLKLKGRDEIQRKKTGNSQSFKEIDLYEIIEKVEMTLEEKQEEEEKLRKKAEEAKEKYLMRKMARNQKKI